MTQWAHAMWDHNNTFMIYLCWYGKNECFIQTNYSTYTASYRDYKCKSHTIIAKKHAVRSFERAQEIVEKFMQSLTTSKTKVEA